MSVILLPQLQLYPAADNGGFFRKLPPTIRMCRAVNMHDNRSRRSDGYVAICVAIASLLLATTADAQISSFGRTSPPMYGGSGISTRPSSSVRPLEGTFAPNHTTVDGKLCISVNPLTHPQANNPKIIEQIVLVQNICGQSIRVRVCYAGSSDCMVVPLAGYQKLQRLLGIAAGSTNFQFEYRELY
ncbi:hypothetical protein ACVWXM_001291 [Bradyrhizobium sp. GM7.3]